MNENTKPTQTLWKHRAHYTKGQPQVVREIGQGIEIGRARIRKTDKDTGIIMPLKPCTRNVTRIQKQEEGETKTRRYVIQVIEGETGHDPRTETSIVRNYTTDEEFKAP